ncbi:1,4-dihydroxy-2-naphthoate polyprenyltransferase [Actinoallomurus iriomotensis]|uniref:1,4-dihydroxy-2-naphthoate octaprenyltransferase n=1 Tax=Actinoallomurus iriomotensis TaxID=478107 RepID=A0A9W6SAQ2_9ACTN|nr:1,4-dihydroxy-2-naphthoate polyprenyltransferase [Actinoallomurus iriomotensis]GLY90138.1 1,4-dihydroxy-2-naphthoate octaprenyltransferase [Actinoallomurus iriomotensis]
MASLPQWVAGARPRTLPNSIVPVLVGTGIAIGFGHAIWWRAVVALLVSMLLQIGVNYANDYSDGIRGTDEERVGPMRLVGSKVAPPRQVLAAAAVCFLLAAIAGLVLAAVTSWWLLLIGAAAIAAAWFYTGGSRPYGYRALGEISVFVFFGLVSVVGTAYVQLEGLPWAVWIASVPVGLLSCSMLVVNNLRDIPTDREAGKRTLAVVLGDGRTRLLYAGCAVVALCCVPVVAAAHPWAMIGLLSALWAISPVRRVLRGATGPELIAVLGETGRLQIVFGVLFAVGLAV